jgi:cob(I)alamin adenosyltransferase
MEKNEPGLVHIYTGEGKGKTSAAMGVALRAIGHGLRVYVCSFLKPGSSGEFLASPRLAPHLIFDRFSDDNKDSEKEKASELVINGESGGFKNWYTKEKITGEDRKKAARSLDKARTAMLSGQFQVVVLDEVIVAHDLGILSFQQIKQFTDDKPADVELILTGRGASPELIELADVVTEMKEIKHPYRKGIKARKGIDF